MEQVYAAIPTRAQMEAALVEVAWDYYLKGPKAQYCGQALNVVGGNKGKPQEPLSKFWGGGWRIPIHGGPENATSHTSLYTVCSNYVWNVYKHALDYPIFGSVLNCIVAGYWMFSEEPEDMVIMRWCKSKYSSCAVAREDHPGEWGITDRHRMDLETARQFLTDWEKNLRPGDLLLNNQHVVFYIGGGWMLDADGVAYDMLQGKEIIEHKGVVCNLHHVEDYFVKGTSPVAGTFFRLGEGEGDQPVFAVLRPLNLLTVDAGTGDPGDDLLNTKYVLPERKLNYGPNPKRSGFGITPAARSRMKYPGMDIDRTVDITPYGSACQGGQLRYSIKITNRSNDEAYTWFRSLMGGKPYFGNDYAGLTVREKIPAGTKLCYAHGAPAVEGDTLTWVVDIPAGSNREIFYIVDVSAPLGSLIVSDGGSVADIPSNRLETTVGGQKLDIPHRGALRDFSCTNLADLAERYSIGKEVKDLAFAGAVYEKGMGISLELPDCQTLLDNLFEMICIRTEHGYLDHYDESRQAYMYHLRSQAEPGYEQLRRMVVHGYCGGIAVYTDNYADEPRINEFRTEYLEPGDILVFMKLSPYDAQGGARRVENTRVAVWADNERFVAVDSDVGQRKFVRKTEMLWESFMYDVFLTLRPSQTFGDLNQL